MFHSLMLASLASLCAPAQEDPTLHRVTLADDATITLEAFWEPVTQWAMNQKDVVANEILLGVKPVEKTREVGAERFRPFLPEDAVSIGKPWKLDREAATKLLEQFHPGASSRLGHEPVAVPGSHALLRAVNERYMEFLTRSHATFYLEEDIKYNTAQFEGRLLIDRKSGEIVSYSLHLPSRFTNLDVNVPTVKTREMGGNFGVPDLGWVPRMELVGGERPSGLGESNAQGDLAWDEEISDEKARRLLRECYYGAIDWLPFEDAVVLAEELDKPLHVIAILGTLDDESC